MRREIKEIEKTRNNIWQALNDYKAHTWESLVLEGVTTSFVDHLAEDSVRAKWELRQLFRKSPNWNNDIDALVINGTRTHDPDPERIKSLADQIFASLLAEDDVIRNGAIQIAIRFFANPNDKWAFDRGIEAINALAPKAYAPGKKLSRVFKALCIALGVADETAGSEFQKLFAQIADEMNSKKISTEIFVSINPAHFLTMSNPKGDQRGDCLTSCHSLNDVDFEYNNGCSGYARDSVTFIVFTVDNPNDPETLNNRKTTRQIFAYKPGNGVLLQSRMYNTAGGVYGAVEESKLYRDLIQREISMLEDAPNLWQTGQATSEKYNKCVQIGNGFGGYPDWTYADFDAHISIRADHADNWEPLVVGASGLCIGCGERTRTGLYCIDCYQHGGSDDCDQYGGNNQCDHCETYTDGELTTVHDGGYEIQVCERCLQNYYSYCEACGQYYRYYDVKSVDGEWICLDCMDSICERCECCGKVHRPKNMIAVYLHSSRPEGYICNNDHCGCYPQCEDCGDLCYGNAMHKVYLANGREKAVCWDCAEEYEVCPECGKYIEVCDDGACPYCGVILSEEENEEEAV